MIIDHSTVEIFSFHLLCHMFKLINEQLTYQGKHNTKCIGVNITVVYP